MYVPSQDGRKEGIIMKEIRFYAGREFNSDGEPTPWWVGTISYKWDVSKQVFIISTKQTFGTGTAENPVQYKVTLPCCDELNKLIKGFRDMESHCKKVYGE